MRVLPVNYVNYKSRTNNCKPSGNRCYQQNPQPAEENPSFKGGAGVAAGIFGAILGGAALIFAAPAAVVIGAAAVGAMGGAGMADDTVLSMM